MFNTKLKEELQYFKAVDIQNNTELARLKKVICCKNEELYKLQEELKQARDLSDILIRLGLESKNCVTYSGDSNMKISIMDNEIRFGVSDDIPQYVEDIFDIEKKVIKQESNLGILIDKEGIVKIGRTKLPCDKNRSYKLKQL